MAQSLSFDIKLPEGQKVEFNQEATFENFVGQFQPYCAKLLCVVDGTSLHYYDKTGSVPTNIRFDYKQRRGSLTEYYFRDIETDTLYCVFGREYARIFYPRLDEIDPDAQSTQSSAIIIRNLPSEPLKLQSRRVERPEAPKSELQKAPITKRPPIIQPIKPSMPLFHETSAASLVPAAVQRDKVIADQKSNHVVIVDKGVKLTFPNPNYPIEIRTYYPS